MKKNMEATEIIQVRVPVSAVRHLTSSEYRLQGTIGNYVEGVADFHPHFRSHAPSVRKTHTSPTALLAIGSPDNLDTLLKSLPDTWLREMSRYFKKGEA